MSLATAESIRDRIYALLEAITPASLTRDTFRRYRNEGEADFQGWAEKNLPSCLRRFQVRQVGGDEMPLVTTTTVERVRLVLEIRIAYPQSHRYGKEAAMDRDDVIRQDMLKINKAVGIYGRANFTGDYDCTPLGIPTPERESGAGVDFLVARAEFEYERSTT